MERNWGEISKYRDELFGVAILCVFLIHSTYFIWPSVLMIFGRLALFGSIGVDIFLFLSGIGLFFSMRKDNHIGHFYKKRLIRLLPSYIFFAGIGFGILSVMQNEGIDVFFSNFSTVSFWRTGSGTVWFISFIIIMYFVYPLIFTLREKGMLNYIFFFLAVMFIWGGNYLLAKYYPQIYINIEVAVARIPVFIFGCYVAPLVYKNARMNIGFHFMWSGLLFIVFRTFGLILLKKNNIYNHIMFRVSYFFLAFFIIVFVLIFIKWIPEKIRELLRWFGCQSLELYLAHMFVYEIYLTSSFGSENNSAWIYFFIVLPVSAFISVLWKRGKNIVKQMTMCK